MTYTQHSFVTANILLHNRKNARELDITPLRKAAPYMHPTILADLIPLPELATRNTGARRDYLSLNPAPNENFPQLSVLTSTQHPTGILHARRPGNEMRLRYRGEPVFPNLLLEPLTLHARTSNNHRSFITTIKKFSPQVSSFTDTQTIRKS